MKPSTYLASAALMAATLWAPRALSAQGMGTTSMPKDIIETATAAGSFKTLLAAVEAAGQNSNRLF